MRKAMAWKKRFPKFFPKNEEKNYFLQKIGMQKTL